MITFKEYLQEVRIQRTKKLPSKSYFINRNWDTLDSKAERALGEFMYDSLKEYLKYPKIKRHDGHFQSRWLNKFYKEYSDLGRSFPGSGMMDTEPRGEVWEVIGNYLGITTETIERHYLNESQFKKPLKLPSETYFINYHWLTLAVKTERALGIFVYKKFKEYLKYPKLKRYDGIFQRYWVDKFFRDWMIMYNKSFIDTGMMNTEPKMIVFKAMEDYLGINLDTIERQ